MAKKSDFRKGEPLVPTADVERHAQMQRNLDLYQGNFGRKDGEDPDHYIRENWFRLVALSYAQFLFGERPVVSIAGDDELTRMIASDLEPALSLSLLFANVDLVRLGTGIVAFPFGYDARPVTVSPLDWFPLYDETQEERVGDVIVRKLVGEEKVVLDFFEYDDPVLRRLVYQSRGGHLGDVLQAFQRVSPIGPRRVFSMTSGYPSLGYGESLYVDIEQIVLQQSKKMGELSTNISDNSLPDLYGPEDALQANDDGTYVLTGDRPRYFPIPAGGIPPDYLQWDSNVEAQRYFMGRLEELIHNLTGLTRALFDPKAISGNVTGSALRRLLIPFVSRLSLYQQTNTDTIVQLLRVWNAGAGGRSYDDVDVSVLWSLDQLLGEEPSSESN